MARVTVEDCVDKVPNRFELVLLAAHRARALASGAHMTVDADVRPYALHRYSAPNGSATWRSPLVSRRSVPTFHTRASRWSHAVFMPVATRTVGRHPPSSIPGQQLEPGFGDIPTLSTRQQRFTCVRLTSRHLTDLPPPFPQRSPPQPLCRSSLRWFEP